MLSREQRTEFEERGLLRLPSAMPAGAVTTMRGRFWEALSTERGIHRDRPETWPCETLRKLQALRRNGTFNAMAAEPVRAALDDLLGADRWQRPDSWGLPLVTFPGKAAWRVPRTGWHLDSYGPDHEGVTVFAFLADVAAHGGGTVVLEASHRLVDEHVAATGSWRPADVRAALAAAHPWLRAVWAGEVRADEEAVVGGVRVVLRELTGAAGDIVLMRPRTLHAAAPNAAATVRMMLVEIVEGTRMVNGG
jgi:hypothetical protein